MILKENQKDLIDLIENYSKVDTKILKDNIIYYCNIYKKENKIKLGDVAQKLSIKKDTLYAWRNHWKVLTPNFVNALRLCELFNISVYQLLEERKDEV